MGGRGRASVGKLLRSSTVGRSTRAGKQLPARHRNPRRRPGPGPPGREPARLGLRPAATQLGAGVLFGIGDLTLLGLVARVGTGTGFTIAQLSLLVNASIGIWAFHVPKPGTPQARKVLAGILIAGAGGCVIGAMR